MPEASADYPLKTAVAAAIEALPGQTIASAMPGAYGSASINRHSRAVIADLIRTGQMDDAMTLAALLLLQTKCK
jgi:hypothetical protein